MYVRCPPPLLLVFPYVCMSGVPPLLLVFPYVCMSSVPPFYISLSVCMCVTFLGAKAPLGLAHVGLSVCQQFAKILLNLAKS